MLLRHPDPACEVRIRLVATTAKGRALSDGPTISAPLSRHQHWDAAHLTLAFGSPGQKFTSRVAPESERRTAVRQETLDGEQPALGLAIDSVRPMPGARWVGPLA